MNGKFWGWQTCWHTYYSQFIKYDYIILENKQTLCNEDRTEQQTMNNSPLEAAKVIE